MRYSWGFNGQRNFLQQDTRRFVSQKTGNLYIAKVEALDAGNYTCTVRNMMTNVTVFSPPTPVVVRRDGKHSLLNSAASWLSCGLNCARKGINRKTDLSMRVAQLDVSREESTSRVFFSADWLALKYLSLIWPIVMITWIWNFFLLNTIKKYYTYYALVMYSQFHSVADSMPPSESESRECCVRFPEEPHAWHLLGAAC